MGQEAGSEGVGLVENKGVFDQLVGCMFLLLCMELLHYFVGSLVVFQSEVALSGKKIVEQGARCGLFLSLPIVLYC